jgi:hypothetical protein
VALAVVALAVVACRAKEPALVLEFVGLPADAQPVTVVLSSDGWQFTGMNVPSGSVRVLHDATGLLSIEIDRKFLGDRNDRLRLGLKTPQRLTLAATADTTASGQRLSASDMGTAVPGQDLTLHFEFQPPPDGGAGSSSDGGLPPRDGAPDATGASPGGTDGSPPDELVAPPPPPPPDAGPGDGPVSPLPPDAAVDLMAPPPPPPPDALPPDGPTPPPPDGPVPTVTCSALFPMKPISASVPSTAPTLQVVGPLLFAAVWPDDNRVLFNSVDGAGNLQHASDVVSVTADVGTVYRNPRMVRGGGSVFISYGRTMSGGNAGVPTRILMPTTGGTSNSLVIDGPTTDGSAPELSGLAFGTRPVLLSRASVNGPTQARLDRVNADFMTYKQVNHPSLAGSRIAALAWADQAARFGAAAIVDGSQRGGVLSTFDADLGFDRSFSFTSDGSMPVFTGAGATMAVAGAGDRFAIVWIDAQPCPACMSNREVFLSLVTANGAVTTTHVSASGSTLAKSFPHVAFDGTSYAVIWEESDGGSSRVMFRRFDADLRPLGALVDLSASAPARPVGDIDLVAESRNSYGVVVTPLARAHHFTRITCSGP